MTRPRWARILLAAARLAAIYAAGVLILLVPLVVRSWRAGFAPQSEPWLELPLIGVVCFVLGFVALAAVKRLGFALLWGLFTWWWILMIRNSPGVAFLDEPFLFWSAFAAPLYVLSAVGLSSGTGSSRRWQIEFMLTLLVWLIVAVMTFFFAHPDGVVLRVRDAPFQYSGTPRGFLIAAWPFLIGSRELGRVVSALWRSRRDKAAA